MEYSPDTSERGLPHYLRVGFVLKREFMPAAMRSRYFYEMKDFKQVLDQFNAGAVHTDYLKGRGGPLLWRLGDELTEYGIDFDSEFPSERTFLVAVSKENKEALKEALKLRPEVQRLLPY